MKTLILLGTILLISNSALAQFSSFLYTNSMGFSIDDSLVSPYLCTVDSSGNLWVASSNTVSVAAINGLFKAASNDTSLRLVVEFANSDSVRNITGITAIGNDIFVSARMTPYLGAQQPYYYPYSQLIYFPNGDPTKMIKFKQPDFKDYGTWYSAITSTKDGYIYFGQSYLVTVGTIDGRKNSPKFGWTVDYARVDWSTPMEPGGGSTYPNVMDLIRDAAVSPGGNYSDTSTVLFTSRNSSIDPGGNSKGGIAAWIGGTESNPLGYRSVRVNDVSSFLIFGTSAPYGLAINPKTDNLFVCGTDSTKKWVKGFQVSGNFAVQTDELPSNTSMDVQDPKGAPFIAPADVAFSSDGTFAYVADESTKKVFKFKLKTTDVPLERAVPTSFKLSQNYPNPFNPTTIITYSLPQNSFVSIKIYDMLGREVRTLVNSEAAAGKHAVVWNGEDNFGNMAASGIYFYRITATTQAGQAGNFVAVKKMILIK